MKRSFALAAIAVALTAAVVAVLGAGRATSVSALPAVHPTVADYQQITASTTPPSEAQCFSVGRRSSSR